MPDVPTEGSIAVQPDCLLEVFDHSVAGRDLVWNKPSGADA